VQSWVAHWRTRPRAPRFETVTVGGRVVRANGDITTAPVDSRTLVEVVAQQDPRTD
jgi:hypothetical protein